MQSRNDFAGGISRTPLTMWRKPLVRPSQGSRLRPDGVFLTFSIQDQSYYAFDAREVDGIDASHQTIFRQVYRKR